MVKGTKFQMVGDEGFERSQSITLCRSYADYGAVMVPRNYLLINANDMRLRKQKHHNVSE